MNKSDHLALEASGLSKNIKLRLIRKENELRELHTKKAKRDRALSGSILAKKRTEIVDKLIRQAIVQQGFKDLKNVAIVALGGYGRNELCPYSDIDLMFLYKPRNKSFAKDITEKLLYLLWDLNFEVGHSVRTIDECMELCLDLEEDTTILTSLLDSRLVFGDKELYKNLESKLFNDLMPSISSKFIQKKIEENEERINRFGRSIYLIEPNVKEGEGGLRDIHYALWIAQAKFKVKTFDDLLPKGVLLEKELRTFEKGLNFLLLIRSELHYLAERREDRLGFEFQEKIARFLGFKNAEISAVERFMRIYYLRANEIREQSKRLIERCVIEPRAKIRTPKTVYLDHGFIIQSGMLSVSSAEILKDDPANLMRAFEYSDKHDLRMNPHLIELIRENVNLTTIDESVRSNPEFNASFLRLLKKGKNVADTLFEMNRLRLLGYFIPEFGKIVCMGQHDAYHVYTVDVHSIFMVREIENLINYKNDEKFPLLTKTAESLMKRHVLYLACLFHDMGKGEGRNHSQKGAAMIPKIAKRMGLTRVDGEQLEFLVKHHLIMTHFSQRRDIHDFSLIARFARSVKTLETLSLLYLLTFADVRSVGPDVWTNWKGMLLKELYIRTVNILAQGEFKKEEPTERLKRVTEDVIGKLDKKVSKRNVKSILSKMPDSYFLGFSPRKIASHVEFIDKSKGVIGFDLSFFPNQEFDELTIWGKDEHGIFSRLCGVIRASGFNILGARIATRRDGRILDVFYVNRLGKSSGGEDALCKKLDNNLNGVLSGKLDLEKLVARRKKDRSLYGKTVPQYPTRIEVDNEASDKATVIDVYTYDRGGLLYDITKTIRELNLSIGYAKISTKVDQVVDAFYVVDNKGKKITDKETIEDIKAAIFNAIANG
ncbi:MAG: [protein-PII] uridylyltransferase [Thermodesulfobacteriota bacterium]